MPVTDTVTPVLLSGQAYIRNYQDGVSLSEQQETDLEGVFPLALWTDKMFEDGTLSQLSEKWFGMDVTEVPEGEVNYVTTTGDNAWQSYEAE